jgi:hypothetical protein
MARQDSTDRSKAGRHRSQAISNARHRLCAARSGSGEQGCDEAYRPVATPIWQDSAVSRSTGLNGNAMVALVPHCEPDPVWSVRTICPECAAELAVLKVIPGRAAEYWTLRCDGCGGIHLDIVDKPRA